MDRLWIRGGLPRSFLARSSQAGFENRTGYIRTFLERDLPQLGIRAHPKCGASWEGFVMEQVIRQVGARPGECFFWATHAGAELDLMTVRGRKRLGFEIKRTSAPGVTPSMRHAMEDLKLSRLTVVHAGDHTFPMSKNIQAVPAARILSDVARL